MPKTLNELNTAKKMDDLFRKDVIIFDEGRIEQPTYYTRDEVDELLRVEHAGKLLAQTDLVICKNKLNQLEYSRRIPLLQAEHYRILKQLQNELREAFESIDNIQYPVWMANQKIETVFNKHLQSHPSPSVTGGITCNTSEAIDGTSADVLQELCPKCQQHTHTITKIYCNCDYPRGVK